MITAVCLFEGSNAKRVVDKDVAKITVRDLTAREIDDYVASGEGLDKAGGYGIQGAAGKFVATLEGAFDNVMGLPIALVEKLLRENGWDLERRM